MLSCVVFWPKSTTACAESTLPESRWKNPISFSFPRRFISFASRSLSLPVTTNVLRLSVPCAFGAVLAAAHMSAATSSTAFCPNSLLFAIIITLRYKSLSKRYLLIIPIKKDFFISLSRTGPWLRRTLGRPSPRANPQKQFPALCRRQEHRHPGHICTRRGCISIYPWQKYLFLITFKIEFYILLVFYSLHSIAHLLNDGGQVLYFHRIRVIDHLCFSSSKEHLCADNAFYFF